MTPSALQNLNRYPLVVDYPARDGASVLFAPSHAGLRVSCSSNSRPQASCTQKIKHVKNNDQIAHEYGGAEGRNAAPQFTNFEGYQQSSGAEGKPLRPPALLPQSVGFGKTKGGISERQPRRRP